MRLPSDLDGLARGDRAGIVYGEPREIGDGSVLVTVARVRAGRFFRKGSPDGTALAPYRVRPVGVFVIRDGKATWEPVVDTTRVAVVGVCAGVVAALCAGIAMIRRPPWPDLTLPGWSPAERLGGSS